MSKSSHNPIIRFFVIMLSRKKIPDLMTSEDAPKIVLSLWNVFRSREQRLAFQKAGLAVHWVGNHYPPYKHEVAKRSFAWLSFVEFMLFFRNRKESLKYASMRAFDRFSGRTSLKDVKLVWAYVEMNTRLLRKAKRLGIPTVLDNPIAHMRDYYEILKPEYEKLGMEFYAPKVLKWVEKAEEEYKIADWFNVGSQFVKKSLVEHGVSSERIIVNHAGVDTGRWKSAHDDRAFGRKIMTFVYTGAVCPRKGIHYLVQAWDKLNPENAELLICGSGSMPWDKVLDGRPMPRSIHFLGRLTHDNLAEVYAESDAYVLPSLLEGFARTGLEAMAAGLPLIITEETGLTDVCDDGVEGWVVPSRNVDALAQRIAWCISHKDEVRAAGDSAYQRMIGHDFATYGAQCAAIAKSIINGDTPQLTLG